MIGIKSFGGASVSIAIPQLIGGGAEKFTANLAMFLQQEGLLSRVYAGSRVGAERMPGIEVVDLRASRASAAIRRLRKALEGDPAQTFLLTLGYVNLAPLLRLLRPRAHIVLRIGNTLTPELRTLGRAQRMRYRLALAMAARFADRIIVQCDYMGKDLAKHLPGVAPKLAVVYNNVEDDLWGYQAAAERTLAEPYMFTAASFKPQKAHDVLLAAFARSVARKAGTRLVVAGVAPDDPGYDALLLGNGLTGQEVIRLGFIGDPYRWIAHAEFCVLASRYEGFSNFLLESAALGKRIIATDCPGGNAELFAHYHNAICVPPDDVEALARALGSRRADMPRDDARKLMYPFEKSPVYARYRALLLGEEPEARSA